MDICKCLLSERGWAAKRGCTRPGSGHALRSGSTPRRTCAGCPAPRPAAACRPCWCPPGRTAPPSGSAPSPAAAMLLTIDVEGFHAALIELVIAEMPRKAAIGRTAHSLGITVNMIKGPKRCAGSARG